MFILHLSDYYDYIMSKVPESEKIPLILSGAPFYLTIVSCQVV
jgi:hypothetical protein